MKKAESQPPLSDTEVKAMDGFIGFAEVTGAILAALGLEYATLNGLIRLMPAREQKDKK